MISKFSRMMSRHIQKSKLIAKESSGFISLLSTKSTLNHFRLAPIAYTPHQTLLRSFAKKKKGSKQKNKKETPAADEEEGPASEIDLDLIQLQFDSILDDFEESMGKLQFGELNTQIFEDIEVKAYDDVYQLDELAQILPRNEKSVFLNVYDPAIYEDVKDALNASDHNFIVSLEKDGVLVTIENSNSDQARQAFSKSVKGKGDSAIAELREVRAEEIKGIKGMEGFGKDLLYQAEQEVHTMYLGVLGKVEREVKRKLDSI